ncbi:MAG: TVP38/TMEM64 family protein [Bdellovibrionales bacterium]|nr:TVP38/TMEM64 family protein [Bdellovibrionales bacterium]
MDDELKFSWQIKLIFLFFIIMGGNLIFWGAQLSDLFHGCNGLREFIISQRWVAPLVFVIVSTLAIMVLVPRTLIMILGGICFGARWGLLWVLMASMAATFFSFELARSYGRSIIEKAFSKKKWFLKLEARHPDSEFYLVIISRVTHVVHFGAISYASGLLNLRWRSVGWGTFWGILPGTAIVVYSAQTLGCGLWEGKSSLSTDTIYQLVFVSFLLIVGSIVPLWLQAKKQKKVS